LSKLQELFGPKQGSTLYERVRGIDNRLISESKPRQSVGADVTWGVRFETQDQVYDFVNRLSLHVFSKLEAARLVAYRLQFRILRRTPGAGEPSKRLGHGECDAFSKSKSLRAGITFAMALQEACRMLCKSLNIPPREIRGVGIFLSNLAEKESGPKQTSVFSLMEHSQIDPTEKILKRLGYSREVFDELSEELRQEVIAEATRKKHAEILPTKQREPPTRKRESPNRSFSVKTGTKKAKTSIIEMLTSRPFAFAGLPQEIDQTVLDALPEEIRNELLEEYGLGSSTKS
jgi:DNA repair protein REV1